MMHQINYWPLSFEGVYICTRRRRRKGQCEIVALKINTDFEKKERNRDTHREREMTRNPTRNSKKARGLRREKAWDREERASEESEREAHYFRN